MRFNVRGKTRKQRKVYDREIILCAHNINAMIVEKVQRVETLHVSKI